MHVQHYMLLDCSLSATVAVCCLRMEQAGAVSSKFRLIVWVSNISFVSHFNQKAEPAPVTLSSTSDWQWRLRLFPQMHKHLQIHLH